jgi:hypothetical protein
MTTSMLARGSVGGWDDETDSMCSRLVRDTGRAEAEVGTVVARAVQRFKDARVREFVMLLAERDARRALRASQHDHVNGTDAGGGNGQGDR